jgi:inosine-uridine nucleoside N-ribohydrolase
MTREQFYKNLEVPEGKVDIVLDTDAYNEIDDQFALAYLLRSEEKLDVRAIYAAPFFNTKSASPEDGMEKSYEEILKVLTLAGREELGPVVFKGSRTYLPDEHTPVVSPAVEDLIKRAMEYTPERPLYVVAIGAITNVSSALLMKPEIKERIVLIWLGGHALDWPDCKEFNLWQDVAAARGVFNCGVPFVMLPCMGVVSAFSVSGAELERWLKGKNPLADYLACNVIHEAEAYAAGKPWTRVLWDVTAAAWLLNRNNRFMLSVLEPSPMPEYDGYLALRRGSHYIRYVYYINREALIADLFNKLAR